MTTISIRLAAEQVARVDETRGDGVSRPALAPYMPAPAAYSPATLAAELGRSERSIRAAITRGELQAVGALAGAARARPPRWRLASGWPDDTKAGDRRAQRRRMDKGRLEQRIGPRMAARAPNGEELDEAPRITAEHAILKARSEQKFGRKFGPAVGG
jgi:hypothetical protein